MIGLILPTRGLVHSRTMQAVMSLEGLNSCMIYFSHDRSLPDCFNEPITRALADECQYIWILEEDVIPPPEAIEKLLAAMATNDAAFYDYPMDRGPVTMEINGIMISGTGCIMWRADKLRPLLPFSVNRRYDGRTLSPLRVPDSDTYRWFGGHDVDLFVRMHELGYKIAEVGKAAHCRVRHYGVMRDNNGCHDIDVLV